VLLLAAALLFAREPGTASEAIPETGLERATLASFDRMMRSFVRDNNIPGAALAVAHRGRLVYARGFGWGDVERAKPVQPDALFRIASISKPITAVGLLRLVDQGKLDLDDRVFQRLPHAARPTGEPHRLPDQRLNDITLRHLLQHRGGWDRTESMDPMFRCREIAAQLDIPSPPTTDDIVSWMIRRPLDFDPGDRYAYSNFGYCLLGRLVEQVTNTSYERFVQRRVLGELGIQRMRVGRTLLRDRCDGEVKYYTHDDGRGPAVVGEGIGRDVPRPYGSWCLEVMDAHGGWIGSAVDLVRLASHLQPECADPLLSPATYREMIARPPGLAGHDGDNHPESAWYGLGWQVRKAGDGHNLWHTGAFSGTSTLLVLRHDGLCWAVLFNTDRTPDGKRPANKIDGLIHQAANAVTKWPRHDLFPKLLAQQRSRSQ